MTAHERGPQDDAEPVVEQGEKPEFAAVNLQAHRPHPNGGYAEKIPPRRC